MTEHGRSGARVERDKRTIDQKIFYEDPVTPDRIKSLLDMPEEVFWERVKQNYIQYYLDPEIPPAEIFDATLKTSFEKSWGPAGIRLEQSEVVVFTEPGGLGDLIYILLEALIVAARYPEKKVLINIGVLNQLLRKDLVNAYPNLTVVESKEELATVLARSEEEAVFLDMGKNGARISITRVAEIYKRVQEIKNNKNSKMEQVFSWIRRAIRSREDKDDEVKDELTLSLEEEESIRDRILTERVGLAGLGIGALLTHLIEDNLALRKFLSDIHIEFLTPARRTQQSEGKPPGYDRSTHQLLTRPAKLKFLLGLENASDFLNYNPFELPPSGQKSYDLVIIYDAASSRDKVLSPAKMMQFAEEFRKKHPDAKIGVVVGRTHPEIAEEVFSLDPTLTPIQGEVASVFAELMKSKAVVSVDTVWQHLINFAHHFTDDAPELMTLFSTDAGFPPGYFRPDQGKVAVVKGSLDHCDPKQVVSAMA